MPNTWSLLHIDTNRSINSSKDRLILDGKNKVGHVVSIISKDRPVHVKFANVDVINGNTNDASLWRSFKRDRPFKERKSIYNFIDGAGVLIVGNVSAEFINCRFINNHAYMCGGGVSVQQTFGAEPIIFDHCKFIKNSAGDTGSGLDILTPGSRVVLRDCLFENNHSNLFLPAHGKSGQITSFPKTKVEVINCEFRGAKIDVDYCEEEPSLEYSFIHLMKGARAFAAFADVSYPWISKTAKL